MKTLSLIPVLLVLSAFFFAGCPVSLDYPMGEKGVEKIDNDMLGTWVCTNTDAEVTKARVEKADDFTYDIFVEEEGEMYAAESDQFKAWLTTLEGHRFLILQENPAGEPLDRFYLYHIAIDEKKLVTHDVSLKSGGVDSVSSTETFRNEVRASMKYEDWLSSESTWEKD